MNIFINTRVQPQFKERVEKLLSTLKDKGLIDKKITVSDIVRDLLNEYVEYHTKKLKMFEKVRKHNG